MSGAILNASYILVVLWGMFYYYPYFADEETKNVHDNTNKLWIWNISELSIIKKNYNKNFALSEERLN